ncbi:class I SAM-dependent methyltransferase [Nitrospira sp. M1]
MNNKFDVSLNKIKSFMDDTLDKHGTTSLGVGWRSRENQFLRFDQFSHLFQDCSEPFSINDLGCGLAGFFEWAKERGLPVSNYIGYDISERMIARARALHSKHNVRFVKAEKPTDIADFSVCCGIFNTRLDESDEDWTQYMREVVYALAKASRRGFAFNSLSSYVDWREPHLFYAEPAEWFTWCKTNISKKVSLLHDSPLYEWTMIIRL